MLIPEIWLRDTSLFRSTESHSAHKRNIYGDSGSPCLSPLWGLDSFGDCHSLTQSSCRLHTIHHPFYPNRRESHNFHHLPDKRPLDPVVCLTHVELLCCQPYSPTLPAVYSVNAFIPHHHIIGYQSTGDKGCLHWGYDISKNSLHSIGQSFRNDFVNHIAQTYRSKLPKSCRLLLFGDKDNSGSVQWTYILTLVQNFQSYLSDPCSHNVPIGLVEKGMGPIFPWSFARIHPF